jgi:hypothetical protein
MNQPIPDALLRANGYDEPTFEITDKGEWVATSRKGQFRAAAIGRTKQVAVQQLVKVITRP